MVRGVSLCSTNQGNSFCPSSVKVTKAIIFMKLDVDVVDFVAVSSDVNEEQTGIFN